MKMMHRRSQSGHPHPHLGIHPTVQQKLINTANKMGVPGIANQQGANVNIYDTVLVADLANRQTLQFFNNTSNKSKTFSNWQNGNFQAGESMVATHITMIWMTLSAGALIDSTIITAIDDLSNSGTPGLAMGIFNVTIANTVCLKNYNGYEMIPQFNPELTGITSSFQTTGTQYVTGTSRIKLQANPSILPNTTINVNYEIPAITGSATNAAVMCIIGRVGSIFSAGGTV